MCAELCVLSKVSGSPHLGAGRSGPALTLECLSNSRNQATRYSRPARSVRPGSGSGARHRFDQWPTRHSSLQPGYTTSTLSGGLTGSCCTARACVIEDRPGTLEDRLRSCPVAGCRRDGCPGPGGPGGPGAAQLPHQATSPHVHYEPAVAWN